MYIEYYINELLQTHECVIIPHFGAFILQNQAATLANKRIHPPSKKVMFNSALTINDGLLIKHIEQVESISYNEALEKITQYSTELQKVLKRDKRLSFDKIGIISLDENQKSCFTPHHSYSFSAEYFGLPTIHLSHQKKITSPTPVVRSQKWSWFAAVAILLIIASLGLDIFMHWTKFESAISPSNHLASVFDMTSIHKKPPHNSHQTLDTVLTVNKEIKTVYFDSSYTDFKTEHLKDSSSLISSNIIETHIIVGVFSKKAYAKRAYKKLLKQGYKAVSIPMPNGWVRIGYKKTGTYQEVSSALQQIRKVYKNAWVL